MLVAVGCVWILGGVSIKFMEFSRGQLRILKAVYGIIQARHRGVAQPGSALALGARSPGFESRRPDCTLDIV